MFSKKRKAKAPAPGSRERAKRPSSDESSACASVPGPSSASTHLSSFDRDSTDQDSSFFTSLSQSLSSAFESTEDASDHELPDNVNIMKFVECRASEIASLKSQVQNTKRTHRMQQLPRHMRRRAASHNANRVPRRLREKVEEEIQKAKKGKRPSRKHRRRPSHLLSEYNRRQKNFVWLETHIWFAKRFRMESLWGYKIPIHSNEKSVRSSYKASSQYALLQDLSYLCCIELKAPQSTLLEGLSHLTKTFVGLTFGAKMFLNGAREGHTILYHPHKYPYMCIGPVLFIWDPLLISQDDPSISDAATKAVSNTERQLWIWCHPMCHQELVEVLRSLFQLQENPMLTEHENVSDVQEPQIGQGDCNTCKAYDGKESGSNCSTLNKKISKKVKREKLSDDLNELPADESQEPRVLDKKVKFRFKRTQSYSGAHVMMTLLKDSLVRHRLVGPLAQAIIADTLKPADVSCDDLLSITKDEKWWEEFYCKFGKQSSLHAKQKELWEKMKLVQSPTQLTPGMVFGMTVKDPRLDLPKVKTKMSSQPEERWKGVPLILAEQLPSSMSSSPLWDENIRNEVSAGKLPESELNKMRSQFLVPGSRLDLGREESRVPVIVIQRPGYEGYGSGWDVIAPLGWSMAFWIAFIYRGARASGLRETKSMAREAGIPLFPYDYPDTLSGIQTEERRRVEMMTKHFRYPPDKRPSFGKLGILAPFFRPWETLVSEWVQQISTDKRYAQKLSETPDSKSVAPTGSFRGECESERNVLVLREKEKLSFLKEACMSQTVLCQRKISQNTKRHTAAWDALESLANLIRIFPASYLRRSIVCIQLKCLNKGKPCDFSGIYLPTSLDLSTLKSNPKYGGPVEHVHPIKKKPKEQKTPNLAAGAASGLAASTSAQASKEDLQSEILSRPHIENLISHCDRKLLGFVDVGAFSFMSGCGCGIGHCSLVGLIEVLSTCRAAKVPPTILVRSQSSFQYRFASVNVVTKNNY